MATSSTPSRPAADVRMPYLDGALLVVRGLGGRGPLTVDGAFGAARRPSLARYRSLRIAAGVRLTIGLVVLALGLVLALGPLPVHLLSVVGVGLALIGVVSCAFDLVLLLRLRSAAAAARYEASVTSTR